MILYRCRHRYDYLRFIRLKVAIMVNCLWNRYNISPNITFMLTQWSITEFFFTMTTVLLQNKCIYIAFVYRLCYLAKHNMSKKGLVVFISLCLLIKNVFMLISSLFFISFSVIFIFCCFNNGVICQIVIFKKFRTLLSYNTAILSLSQ